MKFKLITILLFSLNLFQVTAKEINGYFIDNNNQKIDVVFKIPILLITGVPDYVSLQSKIKCKDMDGKKHVFKPHNIKEISFVYNDEQIRLLSKPYAYSIQSMIFGKKNKFILLNETGKINMYLYFKSNQPLILPGSSVIIRAAVFVAYNYPGVQLLLEKKEGVLDIITENNFKRRSSDYFNDCSTLDIDKFHYTNSNVKQLIQKYNATCKN